MSICLSVRPSVRPSVRMEQIDFQRMGFRDSLVIVFRNSLEKIKDSLKSDNIKGTLHDD